MVGSDGLEGAVSRRRSFTENQWFCFNDAQVSRVSYEEIRKTYGGGPSRSGYYISAYSRWARPLVPACHFVLLKPMHCICPNRSLPNTTCSCA